MIELRNYLNINIIAPEYPKYGLYECKSEIASTIEVNLYILRKILWSSTTI